MPDISVDFAGVRLKNPVILSSGTAGFGRELSRRIDLSRLGGIASKGLTRSPREGNGGTRIWETPSGLMNSIGMENPGIDRFISDELENMRSFGCAVIADLGGSSVEEIAESASILNEHRADILELNISCPNVREGGMSFGACASSARAAVRACRQAYGGVMTVKLSPNADDIAAVARACEEEGADGLVVANTYLAMAIDIKKRRAVFDNIYAGLSGPAIRPISLRMLHQTARAVSIPVMGSGGIATARDAIEHIMAGATAVQIGTATLADPTAPIRMIEGIDRYASEEGLSSISEIRGIV